MRGIWKGFGRFKGFSLNFLTKINKSFYLLYEKEGGERSGPFYNS